jgi:GT2 family glycosyltransferase
MSRVVCVVIGRNEGQRLVRSLLSVQRERVEVVYVDSASSDGSVEAAGALGVRAISLDPSERLSAARGRNAGFEDVMKAHPDVEYVQFLDGDSEVAPGWLARAAAELDAFPKVAAVCGRVHEKNPRASIYNALYELDWVFTPGEVEWFGGSAMFRAAAFREAGGFDPTLIAGEDPDLYRRIRARGHTIAAIDHDMVLHDADITKFAGWWTRNVRTGHAYAEAMARRPDDPAMRSGKALRSIHFWGLWLPGLSVALAPPTLGASLFAPLAGYPALFVRVYQAKRGRGFSESDARLYATFCVLGKFPQLWGVLRYRALNLRGIASDLIEYKRPA